MFYNTVHYYLTTVTKEKGMKAGVWDTDMFWALGMRKGEQGQGLEMQTRLKPQVCFISLFFIYSTNLLVTTTYYKGKMGGNRWHPTPPPTTPFWWVDHIKASRHHHHSTKKGPKNGSYCFLGLDMDIQHHHRLHHLITSRCHPHSTKKGPYHRLGLDMHSIRATSPWQPQIATINDKGGLKTGLELPMYVFPFFISISFYFYMNMNFLLNRLQHHQQHHINMYRQHPGTQKEASTF